MRNKSVTECPNMSKWSTIVPYISTEVLEPALQTLASYGCNQRVSSMELTYTSHQYASKESNSHVFNMYATSTKVAWK